MEIKIKTNILGKRSGDIVNISPERATHLVKNKKAEFLNKKENSLSKKKHEKAIK